MPIFNLLESFIDNVCKDQVCPAYGSILYCEISLGYAEHSGVLIDPDHIVHLSGSGNIEAVSPEVFLNGLDGLNTAISIYASCSEEAVGGSSIANRAADMVGNSRDYRFLFDKCHQFVSGCVTGDYENTDNLLWMLKRTVSKHLGVDTWRVWDR